MNQRIPDEIFNHTILMLLSNFIFMVRHVRSSENTGGVLVFLNAI